MSHEDSPPLLHPGRRDSEAASMPGGGPGEGAHLHSQRLSGAQAQALGLVNHAVAQNEKDNAAYCRARALAQEILPQRA